MRRTPERASPEAAGAGRAAGLGRTVAGAGVMALALGAGTGVGAAVTDQLGVTGSGARLVPAVLCSAIAVPLVLVLRVQWDRRSLAGIGLTAPRESTRAFLLGVTVTVGSAAAVLGAGTAAGWVRWGLSTSPLCCLRAQQRCRRAAARSAARGNDAARLCLDLSA